MALRTESARIFTDRSSVPSISSQSQNQRFADCGSRKAARVSPMNVLQRGFGILLFVFVVPLLTAAGDARAQTPPARALAVASAGPSGEIASLSEANEIRVIFSEPMVTLGRIPSVVRAPFFRISPAVTG